MSMETYREMGMSGEYRMTKVRKLSRPTRVLSAGSNSRRLLALSPGAPSCRYQSFCAQHQRYKEVFGHQPLLLKQSHKGCKGRSFTMAAQRGQ